jgi:hypothetical protein
MLAVTALTALNTFNGAFLTASRLLLKAARRAARTPTTPASAGG